MHILFGDQLSVPAIRLHHWIVCTIGIFVPSWLSVHSAWQHSSGPSNKLSWAWNADGFTITNIGAKPRSSAIFKTVRNVSKDRDLLSVNAFFSEDVCGALDLKLSVDGAVTKASAPSHEVFQSKQLGSTATYITHMRQPCCTTIDRRTWEPADRILIYPHAVYPASPNRSNPNNPIEPEPKPHIQMGVDWM